MKPTDTYRPTPARAYARPALQLRLLRPCTDRQILTWFDSFHTPHKSGWVCWTHEIVWNGTDKQAQWCGKYHGSPETAGRCSARNLRQRGVARWVYNLSATQRPAPAYDKPIGPKPARKARTKRPRFAFTRWDAFAAIELGPELAELAAELAELMDATPQTARGLQKQLQRRGPANRRPGVNKVNRVLGRAVNAKLVDLSANGNNTPTFALWRSVPSKELAA